jgi:hypothetical protein
MIRTFSDFLKFNEEISFKIHTVPKDLIKHSNHSFEFRINDNNINVKFMTNNYVIKDKVVHIKDREYSINGSMFRDDYNKDWKQILEGVSYITKQYIIDNNLDILMICHISTSKNPNEKNRRAELNKFYLNEICKETNMELIQFQSGSFNTTYSILYNHNIDYIEELIGELKIEV